VLFRSQNAAGERVRFHAHAALSFPPVEIKAIDVHPATEDRPEFIEMTVPFLGIYGPSSPLPAYFTEHIISTDQDRTASRRFLDLFNHRLIGLLYRIWRKYRYYVAFKPDASDDFSRRILSTVGLSITHRDQAAERVDWARLLPYAGLVSMYGHSGAMIAGVLQHYFRGLPVEVEEWVRREVLIEPAQRSRLGVQRSTLGEDVVLGERLEDMSGKFRLRLGPLTFEQFRRFLPDGADWRPLRLLTLMLLRDPLEFDVEFIVDEDELPPWKLGTSVGRLGWSMWLGRPAAEQNRIVLPMSDRADPGIDEQGQAGREILERERVA
jgi:type VI secretion system protein ImpH